MTLNNLARLFFGGVFLIFGLNGFLQFMPMPPMPEAAGKMMMGLAESGYFFPLLKAAEVVCGALIIANIFVPLALIILAPIVLNILLFHIFLAPGGLGMAIILSVLQLYLAWQHKDRFEGVLRK